MGELGMPGGAPEREGTLPHVPTKCEPKAVSAFLSLFPDSSLFWTFVALALALGSQFGPHLLQLYTRQPYTLLLLSFEEDSPA